MAAAQTAADEDGLFSNTRAAPHGPKTASLHRTVAIPTGERFAIMKAPAGAAPVRGFPPARCAGAEAQVRQESGRRAGPQDAGGELGAPATRSESSAGLTVMARCTILQPRRTAPPSNVEIPRDLDVAALRGRWEACIVWDFERHNRGANRTCRSIQGNTPHAIRASMSIGFACNGATPIAIVNATRPSIFAVDFRLLGLRLPASSRTITVWLTHIERTGPAFVASSKIRLVRSRDL